MIRGRIDMAEDTPAVGPNKSTVRSKFPGKLGTKFVAIPAGLFEHREALDLEALDLLIVIALERHRRERGAEVFPSLKTLGAATGLSERTLRNRLSRLDQLELVPSRPREGTSNTYDLEPLWQRIAGLAGSPTPAGDAGVPRQEMPGGRQEMPGGPAGDAGVPRHEVPPKKKKVDLDQVEVDERGKTPAPAHTTLSEILRQDAAHPDTFPSTRVRLLAEAEKAEQRERRPSPEELLELAEKLEHLERLAEHGLEADVVERVRNGDPMTNRDDLAIRAAEARARAAEPEVIEAEAIEVAA